MGSRTLTLLAAAGGAAAAAGLAALGCAGPRPAPTPVSTAALPRTFVGSAACADCHPKECSQEGRSRHAMTLHLTSDAISAGIAPAPGPIPPTKYAVLRSGTRLMFAETGAGFKPRRVDLIIGSGKNGVSLVSVRGANALEKMRMSYFPVRGRWEIHPGDETLPLYAPPDLVKGEEARGCVECHTTTVAASTLVPESRFCGIGCEGCHGPGRAHVAVEQRSGGAADPQIDMTSAATPRQVNEQCARCHGKALPPSVTLTRKVDTVRWVTNAVMQSRCFWQSGERLSCVTCHDPHGDAASDHASYDRACRGCHGPRESAVAAGVVGSAQPLIGRQCPKSPTGDCVKCHMPPYKFYQQSHIPTVLTDHYIRLDRPTAI